MLNPIFLLATVAFILTIIHAIKPDKVPDWIGLLLLCVAIMVLGYSR